MMACSLEQLVSLQLKVETKENIIFLIILTLSRLLFRLLVVLSNILKKIKTII